MAQSLSPAAVAAFPFLAVAAFPFPVGPVRFRFPAAVGRRRCHCLAVQVQALVACRSPEAAVAFRFPAPGLLMPAAFPSQVAVAAAPSPFQGVAVVFPCRVAARFRCPAVAAAFPFPAAAAYRCRAVVAFLSPVVAAASRSPVVGVFLFPVVRVSLFPVVGVFLFPVVGAFLFPAACPSLAPCLLRRPAEAPVRSMTSSATTKIFPSQPGRRHEAAVAKTALRLQWQTSLATWMVATAERRCRRHFTATTPWWFKTRG